MGHVVFCGLNEFSRSVHPDIPIVNVTKDTLKDEIRHYIKEYAQRMLLGNEAKDWAKRNFKTENVVLGYTELYKHIWSRG